MVQSLPGTKYLQRQGSLGSKVLVLDLGAEPWVLRGNHAPCGSPGCVNVPVCAGA